MCAHLSGLHPFADFFACNFAHRAFAAAAIRARPSALIRRRFFVGPCVAGVAAALPEPGGRPRRFGAATTLPPPNSPASSAWRLSIWRRISAARWMVSVVGIMMG